ncbi:M23 family metallopeptidase [uncultured Dokdonia sp.]|uniref:M23 family metallopeptidase n=1 Tax=uncultured Dokdonia sp. TaxID=575653 RepID=UPI0026031C89|nr:M23 family metallopeptidase [uncultured Dokdonia sp.]
MKRFLFLIVCLVTSQGFSQILDASIARLDAISFSERLDIVIKKHKSDSLSQVYMTENWDATTFNPYKEYRQTFPFQISFSDSVYISPITRQKVVTSRYGWRNRRAHKGIDIDLITGDDVLAMFDGKVRAVRTFRGLGKTVVIRHNNGLETVYAHLSKQSVKENDTITKGTIIGKGGNTGNSRGSHLHLIVSYRGMYINPEYLFEFTEENKIRSQELWVTRRWVTPYLHSSKRQSTILIAISEEEALQNEEKQQKVYIVKKGDTLSKIANRHHTSITAICKENSIKKTSTLRIGQQLVVNK